MDWNKFRSKIEMELQQMHDVSQVTKNLTLEQGNKLALLRGDHDEINNAIQREIGMVKVTFTDY